MVPVAFAACLLSVGLAKFPSRVVVAGASGRVGGRVVRNLIRSTNTTVVALTRSRASEKKLKQSLGDLTFPSSRLAVERCDLRNEKRVAHLTDGAESAIWCATGFSDGSSAFNKVRGLLSLASGRTVDIDGIATLGRCMRAQREARGSPSEYLDVVMCSSAGVTRTQWDEEMAEVLVGAADIPIVRLNPFGILDQKRKSESALRSTGCRYVVVRPTGLNDNWPTGRPIMSQGDLAVGRINREDVAQLLCSLCAEPSALGKTFEVMGIPGYPKLRSLATVLNTFATDAELEASGGTLSLPELRKQYVLLQQLLPGEAGDASALAAGQTYEQFDAGEAGRLGARGEERVPLVKSG